jgi:hypothetical protein
MKMLTIDLEKELLSTNSKMTESDLLIKEINNLLAENTEKDINALKRIGLLSGKNVEGITRESKIINSTSLDKGKIFTQNQIKDICEKYHLRFLPTRYYNGTIDPILPSKIREFESLVEAKKNFYYYVMAPAESFDLEERPLDPLFFAQLYGNSYYLVHKWGNDLSINRRISSFFYNRFNKIQYSLVFTTFLTFLIYFISNDSFKITTNAPILCSVICSAFFSACMYGVIWLIGCFIPDYKLDFKCFSIYRN